MIFTAFVFFSISVMPWVFLVTLGATGSLLRHSSFVEKFQCETPSEVGCSVILPVHNTPLRVLERKIQGLVTELTGLDGAEIIIVFDGCAEDLVRGYSEVLNKIQLSSNVALSAIPSGRVGKSGAQNLGASLSTKTWLFLNDCDTEIPLGVLRDCLIANWSQEVGIVSGAMDFGSSEHVGRVFGVYSYWAFENALRSLLTRYGLLLTSAGPGMLVRRSLWPKSGLALNYGDDCALPLISAKLGYRVLHNAHFLIRDQPYATPEREYAARVRMAERNLAASFGEAFPWILRHPLLLGSLLLHRILRWLSPALLVIGCFFWVSASLINADLDLLTNLQQVAGLVFVGIMFLFLSKRSRLLGPITYMAATLHGSFRALFGRVRKEY